MSGWDEHIARIQDFYTQRRNVFLNLLEKHLKGLAEWWVPSAGTYSASVLIVQMFVSILCYAFYKECLFG